MTIDIITLTAKQYAALSAEQLDKVRAAQLKKDGYKAAMEEEKRKKKYALVRAGIFRSCVYENFARRLRRNTKKKRRRCGRGCCFTCNTRRSPKRAAARARNMRIIRFRRRNAYRR